MNVPTEEKIPYAEKISLAKVSMWQAILVALITACGGFITAYLTNPQPPKSQDLQMQHWVSIDRVELINGDSSSPDKFRINIEVNSFGFSFPTNSIWASIGPATNGEKFALPATTNDYRIKFSAIGRVDDNGTPFQEEYWPFASRELVEIKVKQLPLSGQSISLRPTLPFSNQTIASNVVVYYSLR